MKNIQGTEENLELFDKNGKRIYSFLKSSNGYSYEYTYDENGNERTFKSSDGYSWKHTYDEQGNKRTYKNSDGVTTGFDTPEFDDEDEDMGDTCRNGKEWNKCECC